MSQEEIIKRLDEAKAQPNKIRGQNFLFDNDELEFVVSTANISEGTRVLEIGPGVGNLTDKLLESGAVITAVEIDDKFAKYLSTVFGKEVNVVHSDILHFDESQMQSPYVVVGNIPYYITGKILRKFLESKNKPERIVLTVQKEVAERISQKEPRSSLLSNIVRLYGDVDIVRVISKDHFYPAPKVDSSVIVIDLEKSVPSDILDLIHFIKIGFAQPRKTLKNNLKNGLGVDNQVLENFLDQNNFSETVRPHELSLENWRTIFSHFGLRGD